jgi:hypothetical protein
LTDAAAAHGLFGQSSASWQTACPPILVIDTHQPPCPAGPPLGCCPASR